jgi:fructose-1,6-bisphosphatase/inositol monophosphatase family enzyme
MVGEETGGTLPESGFAVAIDPIDGTWAFLNGTETYATTLGFFHDHEPFLGMVSNPATGEIGYATSEGTPRLLQLSLFGEADAACALPRPRPEPMPLLVNVHPSRHGSPLITALHEAWSRGEIHMVRSPGGSPAWALLEAAKGAFVYVNGWAKRPAEVYDLVAGVLLVRRAGGEVTDLEDRPIDMLHHHGPFVASIDAASREKVIEIVGRVATS